MIDGKWWMIRLLFLLFIIFPFGQLFRFSLYPGVNLHILDIICFLLSSSFLLLKKDYKWPAFTWCLTSFWLVALFSLLVSAIKYDLTNVLVGALYLIRFIVYSSLYFVVDWCIKNDKTIKQKVLSGLQVVGFSIAVFGLLQYVFYRDIRPLKEFGWDPHLNRLFGTFIDPAFIGILLVFYLLLICNELGNNFKKIHVLQLLLGLGALYLTYSRASYLALLAGLAGLLIAKGKTKILLVSSFLFIISLFFLPRTEGIGTKLERTSTILSRVGNYQETLVIISKEPLFGVGFKCFRKKS
jgi:hypothetical protein